MSGSEGTRQLGYRPLIGVVEFFRPGEYERVESALSDMKALGVRDLRTAVSWADWHRPEGPEWYDWLLPRLGRELNVLPCFHYTPPSLAVEPKASAPPRRPRDYADFLDQMITRYGAFFEWLEIWNEPNNLNDWDWRLDPGWLIFANMASAAAHWCHERGKKTVLAGMCPTDPNWLRLMCEQGVMQHIDAVGVHAFPGTWQFDWTGWESTISTVRTELDRHGWQGPIWITEAGFSTWRHDEHAQVKAFVESTTAPVDRVYWYSLHDLHPDTPTQDGLQSDVRHYHLGLKTSQGAPKLLHRLWTGYGLEALEEVAGLRVSVRRSDSHHILVTGGAGFVGANVAHHYLSSGTPVMILDNLSRPGAEHNLRWLRQAHGDCLRVEIADVRDRHALRQAVRYSSCVFHFAAQVAVTGSISDPVADFEINARGTLNLLEELRLADDPPPVIFTSTNKVYGSLQGLELGASRLRYEPVYGSDVAYGIAEDQPLDLQSPYGCSKGAADQYILEYARTYGLQAIVMRMSCIYGARQMGTEDQGWVAHFVISAHERRPIVIYGDGRQVRDLLYIDDLIKAFEVARRGMTLLSGRAYNIGGGPQNTISLLELLELLGDLSGRRPDVRFEDWRPGDQRHYVSDIRRFVDATGWSPSIGVRDGVARLSDWVAHADMPAPGRGFLGGVER